MCSDHMKNYSSWDFKREEVKELSLSLPCDKFQKFRQRASQMIPAAHISLERE